MALRICCLIVSCIFCLPGCSPDGGAGPFGSPQKVALLDPFQGKWVCDHDRTYAVLKAQGKSEFVEAMQKVEEAFRANPQLGVFQLPHANISIDGNAIVGEGAISQEYTLFALHTHGDIVCGKAWHHEDRHDPGDMSKVWVRLARVGDELHFHVKQADDTPLVDAELNAVDPDFGKTMVMEVDAKDCETPADKIESDKWTTYVFTRPKN